MIQGEDPAGNGTGSPGGEFKNEVSSDLMFDRPGRLAYANSGPDTNGSQFFITEKAVPHPPGGYTIFGQCDDAAVVSRKQIARMARDPSNDKPFPHGEDHPYQDCARKYGHAGQTREHGQETGECWPAAPANPN